MSTTLVYKFQAQQHLRQNRIFRLNRLNFISDVKYQVTKKKGCYVFPGEDCNWSGDPVPLSSSEMGVFDYGKGLLDAALRGVTFAR